MSTLISWATSNRIFSRWNARKPPNSARIVYVPGIRFGAEYAPASSVVRFRATPRATSVIVTAAPGIKAPLWSFTVPEIRPFAVCEKIGAHHNNIATLTARNVKALACDLNGKFIHYSSHFLRNFRSQWGRIVLRESGTCQRKKPWKQPPKTQKNKNTKNLLCLLFLFVAVPLTFDTR